MAENKNDLSEHEFAAILQGLIDRLDEIRECGAEGETSIEEFSSDLLPCDSPEQHELR